MLGRPRLWAGGGGERLAAVALLGRHAPSDAGIIRFDSCGSRSMEMVRLSLVACATSARLAMCGGGAGCCCWMLERGWQHAAAGRGGGGGRGRRHHREGRGAGAGAHSHRLRAPAASSSSSCVAGCSDSWKEYGSSCVAGTSSSSSTAASDSRHHNLGRCCFGLHRSPVRDISRAVTTRPVVQRCDSLERRAAHR